MVVEVTGFKPTWEKHLHAAPTTDADTRALRLNEGQCPTCGAQTHEIKTRGLVRKSRTKVPLTEAGETQRGRCLLCHPVQAPARDGAAAGGATPSLLRSFLSGNGGPSAPPTLPTPPPSPPPKPRRSKDDTKPQSSSSLGHGKDSTKKTPKTTTASSRKSTANFAYVRSASEQTITSILDYSACGSCNDTGTKKRGWKLNKGVGHRRSVRWPRIG